MTARYLQIRQCTLLNHLKRLNRDVCLQSKALLKRRANISKFVLRFFRTNQRILKLGEEIREYDNYWSPFMSVTIVSIIVKICYEVYVSLFHLHNMNLIQGIQFWIYPIVYTIITTAYIGHGVAVDSQNQAILAENRKFYLHLSRNRRNLLKVSDLLKV